MLSVKKKDYPTSGEKMATRSESIYEFTKESMGNVPTHPSLMTRKEVEFVLKMILEEGLELLATVSEEGEDLNKALVELAQIAKPPENYSKKGKTERRLIEEQADAFVDMDYYAGNAAVKKGWNLDAFFNVVHGANMAKKFPDGTFHKNQEGKIIKPEGWKEGDLSVIVDQWFEKGTWSF